MILHSRNERIFKHVRYEKFVTRPLESPNLDLTRKYIKYRESKSFNEFYVDI